MAFQPPNTGQERQNRKILEQIEEQKKRLRMGQTGATPPTSVSTPALNPAAAPPPAVTASGATGNQPMMLPDTQAMTQQQRTALQHANSNSAGYFITQDSSFGNLILPVLPRFEKA